MKKAKPDVAASGIRSRGTERSLRERLLNAAFTVFRKRGFSGARTLDIATRARVSKRELYALFESKHAILVACIAERASRMREPLGSAAPVPKTQEAVAVTLRELGASILRGVCHHEVLAVYRLAIAELDRAPEIARALDSNGRQANHRALGKWLAEVQTRGLIGPGEPAAMVERFIGLLCGDLLVRLLLGVRDAPTAEEIEARARTAADVLLRLPARAGE